MFYEKSTLSNGLTVLSESMDGVRSVALGIWYRVGSRDEKPEQLGLSHFMEHMMFKGTEKRTALDISMSFDAMGAELNAFTSKEYTCYYARVLDERLESAFEILSDMVTSSVFASDAIHSEREVVIEEISRCEDTPDDHIGDLFSETFYPTVQLGRPILGTRELVGAYEHEDCQRYQESHYHAGNATVVASGSIDHERLVALCERYLGAMPTGTPNERGLVDEQNRKELAALTRSTEQAHLLIGMPGVPLGHDDRYAAALLDSILGGPMSSRLFQEVREKRGLAYAVYASTVSYMNAAQFSVYAGTRPSNLGEVLGLIRKELASLVAKGVTPEELARVQEYVVGNLVLAHEATSSRMVRLGRNQVNGLKHLSIDELIERYRAVGLEDIKRVAERVFAQEPTVAVISPLTQDEIAELVCA
ncbi:MAG: insulinase family protein [Coriobacteriales bacterium]|jgi:predicted Zn-dependent peptidase|nr:insulinase family protein [Coriobacteriales bacterium]